MTIAPPVLFVHGMWVHSTAPAIDSRWREVADRGLTRLRAHALAPSGGQNV